MARFYDEKYNYMDSRTGPVGPANFHARCIRLNKWAKLNTWYMPMQASSFVFPKHDLGKKVVVRRSCQADYFHTWSCMADVRQDERYSDLS